MKLQLSPKLALAALLVLTTTCIQAAAQPTADQVLRTMSDKLGSAQEFSFEARRQTHGTILPGHALPEDAKISVIVRRPDGIVARSSSKDGSRNFFFNGKTLTLCDCTKNFYATVPMKTSIDGLLAKLQEKYGFTPPLAELAVSNIYEDIRSKVQGISSLGRARTKGGFLSLGGVECDRILLSGSVVDAELWVGVRDSLLHKLVLMPKRQAGQASLVTTFSDWNLAAKTSASDFTFVPPSGAQQIPMKTTAEMQTGPKKARKSK